MKDKMKLIAKEYAEYQCSDIKEAKTYTPYEIKILVLESYKDGYQAFYEGIRKQIGRNFVLINGEGINKSEYYALGEYLGYEFGVI